LKRLSRLGAAGLLAVIAALGSLAVWGGLGALTAPSALQARTAQADVSGVPLSISVEQLPPQGRQVMTLIYRGGPFQYEKDGVVFGNRERLLPGSARGYYREYTVRTPNGRSRGARRIVCGGLQPVAPDICYYTEDHYASFRKIVQ